MNKNTKSNFATAHKTFRAIRRGTCADIYIDPRCTSHQPRKSTKPKVARSAAEFSKMNS